MSRCHNKFFLWNFVKFFFVFNVIKNRNFSSEDVMNMSDRNLVLFSNFVFMGCPRRPPVQDPVRTIRTRARRMDTVPAFQRDIPWRFSSDRAWICLIWFIVNIPVQGSTDRSPSMIWPLDRPSGQWIPVPVCFWPTECFLLAVFEDNTGTFRCWTFSSSKFLREILEMEVFDRT